MKSIIIMMVIPALLYVGYLAYVNYIEWSNAQLESKNGYLKTYSEFGDKLKDLIVRYLKYLNISDKDTRPLSDFITDEKSAEDILIVSCISELLNKVTKDFNKKVMIPSMFFKYMDAHKDLNKNYFEYLRMLNLAEERLKV